jgi:hypothetical protein
MSLLLFLLLLMVALLLGSCSSCTCAAAGGGAAAALSSELLLLLQQGRHGPFRVRCCEACDVKVLLLLLLQGSMGLLPAPYSCGCRLLLCSIMCCGIATFA